MNKLKQLHEPIGKMVVEFQALEMSLSLLFFPLVNEDQKVTTILINGLSFSKRLKALRALALLKMPPDLAKELADILASMEKCEERRNTIIHSFWAGTTDGGLVFRHKPGIHSKKGLQQVLAYAEISDISEVTAVIQQAHTALVRFGSKLCEKGIIKSAVFQNVK